MASVAKEFVIYEKGRAMILDGTQKEKTHLNHFDQPSILTAGRRGCPEDVTEAAPFRAGIGMRGDG